MAGYILNQPRPVILFGFCQLKGWQKFAAGVLAFASFKPTSSGDDDDCITNESLETDQS